MMKLNVDQYRASQYPALDPTTPWFEWLSYCECCASLLPPGQPSLRRFVAYRNYLKEIGVIK
jgi:hypothetical protein